MTSQSPVHDFLLPRLLTLLDEAVAMGTERDVAVAVMIDLVTSPRFDTAAPNRLDDSAPHTIWQRGPESVVLVANNIVAPTRPFGTPDEADFIKPIEPFGAS